MVIGAMTIAVEDDPQQCPFSDGIQKFVTFSDVIGKFHQVYSGSNSLANIFYKNMEKQQSKLRESGGVINYLENMGPSTSSLVGWMDYIGRKLSDFSTMQESVRLPPSYMEEDMPAKQYLEWIPSTGRAILKMIKMIR